MSVFSFLHYISSSWVAATFGRMTSTGYYVKYPLGKTWSTYIANNTIIPWIPLLYANVVVRNKTYKDEVKCIIYSICHTIL